MARAQTHLFHPDLVQAVEQFEQTRGPETYAALRRIWSTWDRADPSQVEEALGLAARDAGRSPPEQAYARLLTAYARLRRGDLKAAQSRIDALGYVGAWLVAGPFDNEGKAGLAAEYDPELSFGEAIVPGRAFTGKERAVRYRIVPDAFPYGYVDTASLLRPEQHVCAYATTFVRDRVHPDRSRQATLWVGVGGAFKLFVNGVDVLRDTAYRGHDVDRFAARVRLAPGYNNVTIKACGAEHAPVVSLRLADARGAPDAALTATNTFEASAEAVKNATEAAPPVSAPAAGPKGPVQDFEARTGRDNPRPDDLHAYAVYLVRTGGDDTSVHLARNLAQRAAEAKPTAERLLLAALLAEDRNQRAQWVERAEALSTDDPPPADLLLARAAVERESLNFRTAFPVYERLLEQDPDNVYAIRGRVEMYNDAGLRRSGLALLRQAVERNPTSVALLNMYASQLAVLGRTRESDEVRARYSALRFDDRTYLSDRVGLAIARRSDRAAEHWVERLLGVEPDGQWALGTAARSYRSLGQPDRAAAMYNRALALAPEDVGTLRTLADLYGSRGNRDEQLVLLNRILRVRPQEKDVREYVEHIEPSRKRPDEAYAWSADRFLKKRDAPANGHNQRTLLDLTVTTVFDNGLSSSFRQIVFQPLTDSAAALARQYVFQYQADTQRVQLRGARVFRGDGTTDEAIESGEGAADNPAIAMYTSARTFYVQFPRLEPGDVVELRYRIDDITHRNAFADYFGEINYMQSSEPIGHAEYVLITPKQRTFYYDTQRIPGLKERVVERGEHRIYRFTAEAVPEINPEPAMPPWPEVLGYVHVSTYKSWQELGQWYWGLAREQFDLDDETRALARRIAKDAKTDLEKVQAVYGWVVQNTRYVALEFGIYGYKPRRCVQTVSRGWGDCKDKATVIVTLLKELGIDATIVIVRTGMRGDFDSKIASLAPFDHAIAYVPSLDLYLDGTAEHTGSRELPAMDVGALGLLINEGNAKLVRLPSGKPGDNLRKKRVHVELRADGSARLDVEIEAHGGHAPPLRRRYQTAAQLSDRVTEDVGRDIPGFELASGGAPFKATVDDIEEPARLAAHGTAHRFARVEGEELSVDVTPSFRLGPTYASLSSRKLPLQIPPIGILEDTVVVELPKGMKVTSAPESKTGDTPFGRYSLQVEQDDESVTVKSRIEMRTLEVSPDQYAAFRKFASDLDHALNPRLILGPR